MTDMFRNLIRIEVARCFPPQCKGRHRKLQFDDALDCIFLLVRTGMQWREVRPSTASHITVFKTMHAWMQKSVFETAYKRLIHLYERKRKSRYYCIDSTYVKNVYGRDCTGRNPTDRGRKATKLSAIVDDIGIPHALRCDPGNTSDMKLFGSTLNHMMTKIRNIEMFADKGYDSRTNRNICRRAGLSDRIFKRKATCGKRTHAKRNVVERFFSWMDKQRRLLLRYEQKVFVYMEMTFIACGRLLVNKI